MASRHIQNNIQNRFINLVREVSQKLHFLDTSIQNIWIRSLGLCALGAHLVAPARAPTHIIRAWCASWLPKETILRALGGTGGKVKTMVSCARNRRFEWWRGIMRAWCALGAHLLAPARAPSAHNPRLVRELAGIMRAWCAPGGASSRTKRA